MLYAFLLAVVLGFLVVEKRLHRRCLERIPIRIHVNGTRGKTTVTRLAAELFRRAGMRTLAKTTGDHPALILPDGRTVPLRRRAPARIQEQMSIVAVAAKEKAHVLLLECMALDPSLQHVCEHAMLRSTIGVITNVRPDHLEVMGSSPQAVAEALSHTIPAGGVLVTEKGQFEKWFRERARRRGTAVCTPAAQETPRCLAVDDPALAENLALVRSIGITAGIRASEVDDILTAVREKEGRSAIRVLGTGERRIALVDGFSINDTVSAEAFQQSVWAVKRYDFPRPWVALLNARTDRPIRTREFCRFLAAQSVYDAIGLGGRGRFLAWRLLRQTAIRQPLFMLSDTSPAGILQSIGRCTGSDTFTIVGLGNHRGIGETLRGYFEKAAACS